MLKKYKLQLIISSIIIILPIIVGLCIWNLLPEQVPAHWDIHGVVDAWWSKPLTVFLMPSVLLVFQWLCILLSIKFDTKRNNLDSKAFGLVIWIIPLICLVIEFLVYGTALGLAFNVGTYISLFLGALFVVIGNYLPKCKQSYIIGIKLPWTLKDEENWNKTHRFAGIVWVIGGFVIMGLAFLGSFWTLLGMVLVMALIPTIYSYAYYKKHKE